jgi:hypothetical protein
MNLSRRDFNRLALASAALGPAMLATGCNLETDILNYSKVGKAAFDNLVAILEADGVLPAGGDQFTKAVDSAFDAVTAAVNAFQAANPTGTLADISTALVAVTTAINTFLGELNIPVPSTVTLVIALASVILSTIAGFLTKLPPSPAATAIVAKLASGASIASRSHMQMIPIAPKARSVRKFKRDWNAAAKTGGHPEAELRLSFWESVTP